MSFLGGMLRGLKHASDWLRTYKILASRDIPTAFNARKFQMQLVQRPDEQKYVSFRIHGDEQETRATFSLEQATTLQAALSELFETAKPGRNS